MISYKKYSIATTKEDSYLKELEKEIDQSYIDMIKEKDIIAEKLNFGKMGKTAIFLRKELQKIISEIPEVDENNYKEVCKKFINQMERLNYSFNSFTASISYFNRLQESAKSKSKEGKEAREKLRILMPIWENWNNLILVLSAVNIDRFNILYHKTLENEYLDKNNFIITLNKLVDMLNDLKRKSILL